MSSAQAYLSEIEQLAGEKSSTKRRELLTAVTDIFLISHDSQTDTDAEMFGSVLERIAYELEVEVRAHFSEKVCGCSRLSRRLAIRLAKDDIAVARPVIEQSPALKDDDLIDIIRSRSEEHRYSIAGRESISTDVTGALVDHSSDRTIGRAARKEIERLIGRPVFLQLQVRVKKDWQSDRRFLDELGL